jgi:hypothetical protein
MMTFRQMASSAIMTTERIWMTVSRRSAIAQLPIAGQYLDLWWRTNLSNPDILVEWLRGANIENLTSWTGALGGALLSQIGTAIPLSRGRLSARRKASLPCAI